jgi:hypothetical protein
MNECQDMPIQRKSEQVNAYPVTKIPKKLNGARKGVKNNLNASQIYVDMNAWMACSLTQFKRVTIKGRNIKRLDLIFVDHILK